MARRSFGYPRYNNEYPQQQEEVVGVPYISLYDPQSMQKWVDVGNKMQQRYDVAQSARAKYMEDYASAQVSERNIQPLEDIVDNTMQNIQDIVKKYNGQYGPAANEIVQQLSLARRPIIQAQQAYQAEQKARDEYNRLAVAKQTPMIFDKNQIDPATGLPVRRQMSFEEYHQLPQSDFVNGKFVQPSFKTLRGKADITGYLGQNISKGLTETLYQDAKRKSTAQPGYLVQVTNKGMTDEQIDNMYADPTRRKQLADQLRGEVPFLGEEARDLSDDELVRYALPIIKNQVSNQLLRNYEVDRMALEQAKNKPTSPFISNASFNADIVENPFINKQEGDSYTKSLAYKMPWFSQDIPYNNVSDLKKEYQKELVDVANQVKANLKNGNLKNDIDEAINAGQWALLAPMIGTILGNPALGAGTILTRDKRPLDQNDIKEIQNQLLKLDSISSDIDQARENLKKQGVDVKDLNDMQIAQYLDEDYKLRSKTQDNIFMISLKGSEALSNAYNNNAFAKQSGGFRVAGSNQMLPLDELAKNIGADYNTLDKNIMDSKQWNYNFDTGEFGMKINTADKKSNPKYKTIYFNLDEVTYPISEGLKAINTIESNKENRKKYEEALKKNNGNSITIGGIPQAYSLEYIGGDNPYALIITDNSPKGYTVYDNNGKGLTPYEVKLYTKNYILNPYLNSIYGSQSK